MGAAPRSANQKTTAPMTPGRSLRSGAELDPAWQGGGGHSPPYPAFVVGDAAVIILADSTGIPIEDLLPEEFQASWPDLGIYSYFKYVSVDSNRQRLKSAWRRRLSQR
jgi:hypothetical protein